jgi:predicted MFS family arabinose efflux permease
MLYRGRIEHVNSSDSFGSHEARKRESPAGFRMSSETVGLIILFFTCFAVNSDQLASAPNLTLISQNFKLTVSERDSHLGALIQLGFFLSAGVFSILAGPVIEVIDRSKLFGGLAAFSSILSCCSGLIPGGRAGFFYFFLLRISTGVSVGITLPAAFSFLGDLVAPQRRTTMGAFVTTSCAAGAAIGQAIAGLSGGNWRLPFFISSLLSGIACASCLMILTDPRGPGKSVRQTKSPRNRNTAAHAWRVDRSASRVSLTSATISMEDLNWSKFQQVLEVNTNRLIFAQSLPGCIAWSSIATFMPDFLHKDLGFSVKASTGVMAVFGISGLVCALVGSGIGQAIFNKNRKDLPIFVAICICAGAIPMVLLALFGGTGFITILLALFGGVAASAGPNLKGMLMNANSNDDRGSVFSLFSLVDNVGKGLGPSVLVMLTWILGGSRRLAFAVAFGLWFVSAWIAVKLSDCLNEDTLTVEIKQGNSENVREPFDLLHVYHS